MALTSFRLPARRPEAGFPLDLPLLAGVDELVRRLAAVPAPAQQRVKGLLHVVRDLGTDAALAAERRVFDEHWQDAEMIRLLRRFSRDRAIADLPGHRA